MLDVILYFSQDMLSFLVISACEKRKVYLIFFLTSFFYCCYLFVLCLLWGNNKVLFNLIWSNYVIRLQILELSQLVNLRPSGPLRVWGPEPFPLVIFDQYCLIALLFYMFLFIMYAARWSFSRLLKLQWYSVACMPLPRPSRPLLCTSQPNTPQSFLKIPAFFSPDKLTKMI